MSFDSAPNISTEHNTLEILNRERVRLLQEILDKKGVDLRLPQDALLRYLSDIDRGLLDDVFLLGPPEKIMPALMEDDEHKRLLLYFSSEAGESEKMEQRLTQSSISEMNAISAMRDFFLFLGLMSDLPPVQTETLAVQVMGQALRERAIFLAGKYGLQLPPKWTEETPREKIGHLLMDGVRDMTERMRGSEEMVKAHEQNGATAESLKLGDAMENLYRQNLIMFLTELFEKHPDPAAFINKLLDTDTFRGLLILQRMNPIQAS